MSGESSYPEFSLDDVYTGEPKEKSTGWKWCVGFMMVFIVLFVLFLSLPEELRTAAELGFQIVSAFFSLFTLFYIVYLLYPARQKNSEIPDSESNRNDNSPSVSQCF